MSLKQEEKADGEKTDREKGEGERVQFREGSATG
jgi:hypothetical protein